MKCSQCLKEFTLKRNYRRHQNESCPFRHLQPLVGEANPHSPKKRKIVTESPNGEQCTSSTGGEPVCEGVEKINSAFRFRICTFRFSSDQHFLDHNDFFQEIKCKVQTIIEYYLQKFKTLKINCQLFANYVKQDTEIIDTKSFNTRNRIITEADNWNENYGEFVTEILERADSFQEKDSGIFFIFSIHFTPLQIVSFYWLQVGLS